MKLAANVLLAVFWQALGESLLLVDASASDAARALDLLAYSNIGAAILRTRAPEIVAAMNGKASGAAAFDVDTMRKDLRYMAEEAAADGSSLPLATSKVAASWPGASRTRMIPGCARYRPPAGCGSCLAAPESNRSDGSGGRTRLIEHVPGIDVRWARWRKRERHDRTTARSPGSLTFAMRAPELETMAQRRSDVMPKCNQLKRKDTLRAEPCRVSSSSRKTSLCESCSWSG